MLRILMLPQMAYIFSVKSQLFFFFKPEIDKLILKFIWNCKGPRIGKMVLIKKNKIGGLILPDFQTYYKAVVIKTRILM